MTAATTLSRMRLFEWVRREQQIPTPQETVVARDNKGAK
jgi:hypothetical protein